MSEQQTGKTRAEVVQDASSLAFHLNAQVRVLDRRGEGLGHFGGEMASQQVGKEVALPWQLSPANLPAGLSAVSK